jgi:hypothetical protein
MVVAAGVPELLRTGCCAQRCLIQIDDTPWCERVKASKPGKARLAPAMCRIRSSGKTASDHSSAAAQR